MARQIVVDIVGDSSKFTKATSGAVTSAESLHGKLGSFGKGLTIGAGVGAFNLLGDAIDMGIGKLGDAATAFREDQTSRTLMDTAIKNNVKNWNGNTDAVEAFASGQEKLGFSDDEVRSSIGQLIGVTHNLSDAQKLSAEAGELARAKHIDLATATSLLTKAHEGNYKAMKALGIEIPKGTSAAAALDIIQKNVKGSAEAWAETSEGKLAASQQVVQESMEKVGSVVDKVATAVIPMLADAFSSVVDWLFQMWPKVEPLVTQVLDMIGKSIKWVSANVLPALGAAFGWIAKNVIPVVVSALGFIAKNVIPALVTAIGWVTKNVLPALGVAFTWIANNVVPAVKNALSFISTNVIPALKTAFTVLSGVATTVFGAIGTAVTIMKPIVTTVFTVIGTVISTFVKALQTGFSVVSTATGILGNVFKTLGTIIGGVFSGIGGIIRGAINAVINAVNSVIDAMNSIQVHVHVGPANFDFNGMNIGHLPRLHTGGVVPGSEGSDVPMMLQAGEQVLSRGDSRSGGDIHIHIDQGAYIDGPSIDRLALAVSQRLRLQGV